MGSNAVPKMLVGVKSALASEMSCLCPADRFDPEQLHVSHCSNFSVRSAVEIDRKLDV